MVPLTDIGNKEERVWGKVKVPLRFVKFQVSEGNLRGDMYGLSLGRRTVL